MLRKKLLAVILMAGILTINYGFASAAIPIPERVKIGLYYDSTAVSSLTVSAVKGLQFGYLKDNDNKFNSLVEDPTDSAFTIRKDTYFVKSSGVYTEYNPQNSSGSGDKIGPFHIQIGGDYADLNSAQQQIQNLKQKGIVAYTAYTGVWQVWTGFYIDQNAAQADMKDNITKKSGESNCKIINPLTNSIVVYNKNGEVFFAFAANSSAFQVYPRPDNTPFVIKINGKNYRQGLEVRRITGSDMTVINVLPVEEYLYGVIPYEMEADSHIEALKAQAIAARTYTVNNMANFRKWGFDLDNTTKCQVYKGFDGEAAAANKAVDETKGKVIIYNGKPAQIFYFSSSGGRTEDSKNVMNLDLPYLKSVEDKYESGKSYKYNWETTLSAGQIRDILIKNKTDIGDILSVDITKTSDAGRPIELVVKGTNGQRTYTKSECRFAFGFDSQWYTISTDSFIVIMAKDSSPTRTQLSGKKVLTTSGVKTITSNNSSVSVVDGSGQKRMVSLKPTVYKFTGKGWGHAVGMSQEGAKGMAKAGFKSDEILKYYYSGTTVE